MRYFAKFKIPIFIILFMTFFICTIISSLYMTSMLARGLDPRKDKFSCDSLGDIPFIANPSQTWSVTQAINIYGSRTVHSIYLFRNYGFWFRKALILQYTESEYVLGYDSDTAMNGISWQNDSQLIMNISKTEVDKIILKKTNVEDITISYPLLP